MLRIVADLGRAHRAVVIEVRGHVRRVERDQHGVANMAGIRKSTPVKNVCGEDISNQDRNYLTRIGPG